MAGCLIRIRLQFGESQFTPNDGIGDGEGIPARHVDVVLSEG